MPAMIMKTSSTYCVTGANAAAETVRVLKPPSATTLSAWPTASKIVSSSSIPVTAQEPERDDRDQREHDVEPPQPAGGRADRVAELLDLGRPGELGLQQLAAADPQPRQDRHREHDDPHAAEPVRELAPEEHRAVEQLDLAARASRRSR